MRSGEIRRLTGENRRWKKEEEERKDGEEIKRGENRQEESQFKFLKIP